ncbi:MAG: Holliday junction branch migration protein RuvA [Bacteroidales bacterium]|nr:Holliday junction branch migration protein RuvA [Bacteroidales bacterium]
MYEYLSGILAELTPSYAVVENGGGIGWFVNISLNTFSQLEGQQKVKLFVHHVVREDAQLLFGFADKSEREIFRMLIEVSGIGPNTARVILSSMSPAELQAAVLQEDAKTISKVKGIGAKTAQRLVIDLKDKIRKADTSDSLSGITNMHATGTHREEALAALVMLGYQKSQADKAIDMALKQDPRMSTEDLIKFALRNVK